MRAYSELSEEALRAHDLLKDWAGEDFLTEAQHRQMEQETVCDLRRTNIFLRLVLFFFTLVIVGAAVALTFVIFLTHSSTSTMGAFLLLFAAISYGASEFAVSEARFYRYGIEEALAICSIGFLSAGMYAAFFSGANSGDKAACLVPMFGAVLSIWIWHRFGLPYASLIAMAFVIWMPRFWTSSHAAQHVIIAVTYAAGLLAVTTIRPRYRLTYLDRQYSIAEALLWFGIYLAINLQLSSLDLLAKLWRAGPASSEFSTTFYWATYVLIWCLPPVMLVRGLREKDRFVIAAGAIASVLTFVTNKPYLGWPRHTWDPMLLGGLLIGVALFIRRWLARGPGGIRGGFTAQRLSGKDKRWMNAGVTALGLVTPNIIVPSSQPANPEVQFGGGDSGGGGASSDF